MARILIVDDEEALRAAVRMVLQGAGHAVLEASGGEAALEMLRNTAVDLVLLDIQMPGIDGLETLARIRETDKTLPVIMVTGYGSMDAAARAMALGASQYLSKPFKNQLLMETLTRFLPAPAAPPPAPVSVMPAIDTTEPSRKSSAAGWLIALAMALALAGGAYWMTHRPMEAPVAPPPPPAPRVDQFAIPYQNPSGLAWDGDRLWVLDWFSQSLYVHQVKGNEVPILKTYHLPIQHVTGFAVAGDSLFTSDSWSHKIRKHRLDNFLTVTATYNAPGPAPAALYWDGKYLWSSDSREGMIYQLEPLGKLVTIARYKAPARATSGIYKDADFAWTLDNQTRKLYQHRLDDRLTVIATYACPAFDEGTEPLSDAAWKDGELWFVRDRKPFIYRRNKQQLTRTEVQTPIQ